MDYTQPLVSSEKLSFMKSLWFKLFLMMMTLVVGAVIISWVALHIVQGRNVKVELQHIQEDLEESSYSIAKLIRLYNISYYYKNGQYTKIQERFRWFLQQNRTIAYIFLKDEKGDVIVQVPEQVAESATSVGPSLSRINRIPQGRDVRHQSLTVIMDDGAAPRVRDTAVQVGDGGSLHVGIRIRAQVQQMASLFSPMTIVLVLLIIVAAGLIGAVVLRQFIGLQIKAPVRQLIQYIRQIGQGNMSSPLTLKNNTEIGKLGDSLQDMVEQLKGMVQTEAESNRVQGQIMNMLSTVSAAADGNLTVEAEVTADALGSLADAFNMMVASLASLVAQVRGSATDMSGATNDILASSAQMIKGAEEQQNHINNITSAVDEIAVSMQQVANNAEAAARASQKATEAAQKGEDSVEETIRGMHRIRNTVQVTSKKIKSLGDRSIEIGEIITTIDDIARQTTILALNAAIEAARAGEHGRGFGVVAEEVRKLAERSGKATQDIADLIKGIQAETNEAVRTMEEGTREVEEGTRLADLAGSSLKEIDKSVGQVANLIQEISLAAKQQARGTDGVVRSMETISDITNLHAGGVRKTTETIEQLATLSDRLTEAIGNFKISESDARVESPPPRPSLAAAQQTPQASQPRSKSQQPQPQQAQQQQAAQQQQQQPKPKPKPQQPPQQAEPKPKPEAPAPKAEKARGEASLEPHAGANVAFDEHAQDISSFFNQQKKSDDEEEELIELEDFGL